MTNPIEKLPPQSLEAESSFLGSLLIDKDAIHNVATIIDPEDFYKTAHSRIYQAILNLYDNGDPLDLLTVSTKLDEKKHLESIGGKSYLVTLSNTVPTSSHIVDYAKIIKDKSIRRQLLRAQQYNLEEIYNEDKEIDSVLAMSQSRLFNINNLRLLDDGSKAIMKELELMQEEFSEKYKQGQKILGFSTGMDKLNELTDGFRPGHIWIAGAWTGEGKTMFSLNLVNAVLKQNIPTSIISLEMGRVDTMARLIGIRENISAMKVLKGIFREDDQILSVEKSKGFLADAPLEIHTTYFDLEKIKMLIRKDVYKNKVKFVVLDYVQNIISEKG